MRSTDGAGRRERRGQNPTTGYWSAWSLGLALVVVNFTPHEYLVVVLR
jgi:hypothetical protein